MSARILLEVNTDHLDLIEANPKAFVDFIRDYAASRAPNTSWKMEHHFGVKRVLARHHSDKCEVHCDGEVIKL